MLGNNVAICEDELQGRYGIQRSMLVFRYIPTRTSSEIILLAYITRLKSSFIFISSRLEMINAETTENLLFGSLLAKNDSNVSTKTSSSQSIVNNVVYVH